MSHPRWPGFDHKTGDPTYDNWALRFNRKMWKETQTRIKILGTKNRKGKKMLMRVEGGKYILLVHLVALGLAQKNTLGSYHE